MRMERTVREIAGDYAVLGNGRSYMKNRCPGSIGMRRWRCCRTALPRARC